MKKLIASFAVGAAFVALTVLPATNALAACPYPGTQTPCSEDTASFTATVNSTVSLTFSDDTAAFGAVNSGTVTVHLNDLSYNLTANVPAKVTIGPVSNSPVVEGEGVFDVSKDDFATFEQIQDASGTLVNNWRVETTGGSFNYQDDVRFHPPASTPAGSINAQVIYVGSAT